MVNTRFNKMIRQRALTIARTETIDAANQGQIKHWEDMEDKGYLIPETTRIEWILTPDDRLCKLCAELGGKRVKIGEPFGFGKLGPTRHPR